MGNTLSGRRRRGAMRVLGWNALLLAAGVALAALAGEAYLRLTKPFMRSFLPLEFVPNVGYLRPPNTEIRHTDGLDFWNVSRTNSLGFLDREPPTPDRAKATCHVSIIGDSFVEAREVPIQDKLQVRLEELAADRLPRLDVTTSAFGMANTGQIQQLPFYDQYARRLHPRLLVLVFVNNDFYNNAPVVVGSRRSGREKKLTVKRRSDGTLDLAWVLPRYPLPRSPRPPASWTARAAKKAVERSWLALWLRAKRNALYPADQEQWLIRFTEALTRAHAMRFWAAPVFEDGLQYTVFALEQFRERARRDGANLLILTTHTLKTRGTPTFERLSKMAAALGIPVIDQTDYIFRQGASLTDARWRHEGHWNPAGHQWAAEALLEYIEQRPEVCDG